MGEGWNKIIDEHKNHPLKPKLPKIISDKYTILVILYSAREKFEKATTELNERQKRAIRYLRRNERITNKEYQEINKAIKKTATRDLQELVRLGIVIKSGRTGRGVYYSLNPTYYKGDKRGQKYRHCKKPRKKGMIIFDRIIERLMEVTKDENSEGESSTT